MDAQIAAWEPGGDRRFVFLKCYRMMTGNVLAAIDAGEFSHGIWVDSLLQRFAGYYFEALELYQHGSAKTPLIWQYTFEKTAGGRLNVLQQLFLGVNAHINYDLVFTIEEMLRPLWTNLNEQERQAYRADHSHINDVIYRTIDAVQDEVVEKLSPWLDAVDVLLGRLDERLIAGLISGWRSEVWEHSRALLETSNSEDRDRLCRSLEERVMKKARKIVRGGF